MNIMTLPFDIESLNFDEKGLIPAIVVDADSKQVLTLAYMNRESLRISVEKELTCFYSRSRQQLWLKGETSGNYQHIVSITADCDRDALPVIWAISPASPTPCGRAPAAMPSPRTNSWLCCGSAARSAPRALTPPICSTRVWTKF